MKCSVMRAIIKNNHDYRYESKQPWKQFYCLDNTIRTLPGKHGISVVYWRDRTQSEPMTTVVEIP